jgi:hypothetical protein
MGAIRRKFDGAVVFLPNQLIVGRADSCGLVLRVASVSGSHALLRWRDPEWILVDLGSRNGTYLNGRRVGGVAGSNTEVVHEGDELAFAERDETWMLIDATPPRPVLVPDDGSAPIRLREGELVALPTESDTQGYIYCESMVWKFEDTAGRISDLPPGAPLLLGEMVFRLHLPGPAPETPPALVPVTDCTLENVSLDIHVSPDEETAAITALVFGDRFTLPARTHLYLLAHLARQRLASTNGGLLTEDGGWVGVEEACRDLGISTPEALAVTVYRCRKDFERVGIREASRLVDRAKRGLLRIGIPAERLRVDYHP